MTKTAFAIAAHPDDIEFLMAGTLIRLRDHGFELHYMTVANGSCGSVEHDGATTARIRREESKRAAARIGAVFHDSLVNDLEVFYEMSTLMRLSAIVREVAPSVLLTHSPIDYMEDHMNTARLAVTAAFGRTMKNFPTDPPRPAVLSDVTVYHAQPQGNRDFFGNLVRPSLFVDVGDVLEEKVAMLAEHKSQKDWLDRSQGVGSYLDLLRSLARETGQMSGRFEFAEGWRRRNPPGFCAPDADPLREVLGPLTLAAPEAAG